MFAKLFAVASLAIFAVATPTPVSQGGKCNTGPVQCCDSVQKADSPSAADLAGLLGVVVQGVDALIGVNCSPISVASVTGNSCAAEPVCCENNNFNGFIAFGCTPVDINI